jgi:nicotinamide mononucleotide (NMN) deamidase PncC
MAAPPYADLKPLIEDLPTLDKVKELAHKAAYNLLVELDKRVDKSNPDWNKWTNKLQVCTSESLTAGMILSTLVDIPWGGVHKYGGFGVYDTDAKRVFNNVSVDDVYTHRCAKEMAVGILKNSNATLAISVTGNAMPLNEHFNLLGEVFIGVAGYVTEGGKTKIIYETRSINACDNNIDEIKETCKIWHTTIKEKKGWNPRQKTAILSQEIRYYTTCKALEFCLQFIKANNPSVPQFVLDRKAENDSKNSTQSHRDIPKNKYEEVGLQEESVGAYHNVETANRVNTAQYNQVVETTVPAVIRQLSLDGGNRSRRTRKFHRTHRSRRTRKH